MASEPLSFHLNGKPATAEPGETLWQAARRHGIEIEHLCHFPRDGYRADGNCRACLVEVKGERTLAASCRRRVEAGMEVWTSSERATKARAMVVDMLMADHPDSAGERSAVYQWAQAMGLTERERSPLPAPSDTATPGAPDKTHPAIHFNPAACIACGLCICACRDVQSNDVIGFEGRGAATRIVFDQNDPLQSSTCVSCGECVAVCPTHALSEASPPPSSLDNATKVASNCPFCGVGCQIEYIAVDGRIVGAEGLNGPSNASRLCVKGRFGYTYTHSERRLTKPLIRKPGHAKDPQNIPPPDRRLEAFREATWEEALDLAADGLIALRDGVGPQSLAGFGSAKGSNEEAYLFQKLVRAALGTNNVDHCTRLCHASSVAALLEGVGSGAVSAPFMAAEQADVIVVIGARPEWNHPVAASTLKQAAKRGAKLIVMDPRGQSLARYGQQLAFNSGTDVALINAMIHTIIAEGLVDEPFIEERVDGFEALASSIEAFSPEAMAPLTGIDAETIRQVARAYATADRSIIFWGMGVSQHVHGTDNVRALIAMALITGQIGRPGTGLHPLRGQNNVQGASDVGLIPMFLPDYTPVEDDQARARFEAAWGAPLDAQRGLTVVEIMDSASAGTIKGMYIMGENPAMSDPDANHARKGLAALEHLVVQDIFLTETAWLADVVLPASTFYEKEGTFTNTNRQVQMGRRVVAPPGEARLDFDIVMDLARRLGCAWTYQDPRDVFEEMRTLMPSLANITWQRIDETGSVTYPCPSADHPGQDILFADGFPTPTGRARLVPVQFTPPDEVPDTDYPFLLTTGRLLEHWHTGAMTRNAAVLDAIEPTPTVSLHPRTVRALQTHPGETVCVQSRRGEVRLTVRQDREVPENMAFIPFCFFEAAANLLTNPKLDPFGKIPEFKVCAVRIERPA